VVDRPKAIEYQQILITDQVIAELNSDRLAVVSVPRIEIEAIELVKASESKHPIMQVVFGLALVIVGLLPIPKIVDWTLHGGTLFDVQVSVLLMVPVGGVVIYTAIRRRLLLLVGTRRGVRKLAFQGKATLAELTDFVNAANSQFNCNIVSRLPAVLTH
jgi:hypothetical protein